MVVTITKNRKSWGIISSIVILEIHYNNSLNIVKIDYKL